MSVEVKDDYRGYDDVMNIIKELNRTSLEVGIFGDGDAKIMMIAYVNEFGWDIKVTPKMRGYLHHQGLHVGTEVHIPERPYIRGYFDNSVGKIDKFTRRQIKLLMTNKISLEKFWIALGEYLTGQLRVYMTRLKDPPNHPYTIANKRGSNPLIDTGDLRRKITYRTRKVI